jgi:hypothetical protein
MQHGYRDAKRVLAEQRRAAAERASGLRSVS